MFQNKTYLSIQKNLGCWNFENTFDLFQEFHQLCGIPHEYMRYFVISYVVSYLYKEDLSPPQNNNKMNK